MPKEDVTRRRHGLLVDVTQAASEVSRLIHEARDLHLPGEPGVRDGRDAPGSLGPPARRRYSLNSHQPLADCSPAAPLRAGPLGVGVVALPVAKISPADTICTRARERICTRGHRGGA
jgi:hypothetical protein